MNPRKSPIILAILTVLLAAVMISGCTTSTSPAASPAASATTPAATSTPVPTAAGPVSPPHTFTGKGSQTVGPITLNAGTATIQVKAPDLKTAGFVAQLSQSPSGAMGQTIASSADPGQPTNAVDETKSISTATAGDYYINVIANADASWEVTVTQ